MLALRSESRAADSVVRQLLASLSMHPRSQGKYQVAHVSNAQPAPVLMGTHTLGKRTQSRVRGHGRAQFTHVVGLPAPSPVSNAWGLSIREWVRLQGRLLVARVRPDLNVQTQSYHTRVVRASLPSRPARRGVSRLFSFPGLLVFRG